MIKEQKILKIYRNLSLWGLHFRKNTGTVWTDLVKINKIEYFNRNRNVTYCIPWNYRRFDYE